MTCRYIIDNSVVGADQAISLDDAIRAVTIQPRASPDRATVVGR
jgi:hypothetical protein